MAKFHSLHVDANSAVRNGVPDEQLDTVKLYCEEIDRDDRLHCGGVSTTDRFCYFAGAERRGTARAGTDSPNFASYVRIHDIDVLRGVGVYFERVC